MPWIIQGTEYALAAVVAYAALSTPGSNGLDLLGASFGLALLAATAAGPLAAADLLAARTHRRAMVVLSVILLAGAAVKGLSTLSASLPLAVAGGLLLRTALMFRVSQAGTAEPRSTAEPARPEPSAGSEAPLTLAQTAGRGLGVVAGNAQPTLNRAARAAGHLAARHRRPTTRRREGPRS